MEQEQQIERKETGIRILLTVLFVVILRAVDVVLGVIVLFQLVFTLITKRRPGDQVARFANRIITYVVQLLRYVTYQDDHRPFPFSDFPTESAPPDTSAKPNGHAPASLQEPPALTGQ
jgi:hypothetical protein